MNSKANFKAAALARTLAVGLMAATLVAAPSQPAIAQAVQNANGSLELSVGRGRLVSLPATMSDVFEIGRAPSELQSLMRISYAVFCLKNKNEQPVEREQTMVNQM